MKVFEDRFQVQADLKAVSFFHRSTHALKQLTPPPVFVQIHEVEPLAEGSRSSFTMWFGPLRVRWLAVHSAVDHQSGFTDTQERGPMKLWRHTHRWQAQANGVTLLTERVEYEHYPGLRGLITRLLFAPPFLKLMFLYRRWAIRRGTRGANMVNFMDAGQ